ncbi:MAG: rRNA maturation RNase YbeY [Puniceicoccales bacterium]|jgi:probable rRNA maturation factor|nr:rRNA maturation RNase YbeY [Puniceicoccales bacterium]
MRSIQASSRHKGFRAPARLLRSLFVLLDEFERWQIPAGELSIVFLGDAEMIQLHADFLDDPTPTDVITFPGDDEDNGAGESFAGEICVCIDQARREAPKHGSDMASEVLLYLVHGWLHLAGHDDLSEGPRAAMRLAERETLDYLEKAGFIKDWCAKMPLK